MTKDTSDVNTMAPGGSLSTMVLPELRALANRAGVKGTSGMRKNELIAAIQEITGQANGASASSTSSQDSDRSEPTVTAKAAAGEEAPQRAAAIRVRPSDGNGASPRVRRAHPPPNRVTKLLPGRMRPPLTRTPKAGLGKEAPGPTNEATRPMNEETRPTSGKTRAASSKAQVASRPAATRTAKDGRAAGAAGSATAGVVVNGRVTALKPRCARTTSSSR
ncbi:rho termination factor, N-terminal domain protein [Mycobacterium kansasii 824]|nr:rho termination factor, N-terminal domain protein [Mycobacterium kansasii 824]